MNNIVNDDDYDDYDEHDHTVFQKLLDETFKKCELRFPNDIDTSFLVLLARIKYIENIEDEQIRRELSQNSIFNVQFTSNNNLNDEFELGPKHLYFVNKSREFLNILKNHNVEKSVLTAFAEDLKKGRVWYLLDCFVPGCKSFSDINIDIDVFEKEMMNLLSEEQFKIFKKFKERFERFKERWNLELEYTLAGTQKMH